MGQLPRCYALLALVLLPCSMVVSSAQAQMPPSPVRYVEAQALELRPNLRLTGSVIAPRTSTVAAEVAGIVEQILVREGNRVGAGTPLARLRRRPLELRLQAAEAELSEAGARRAAAQQKLDRYRELASSVVSQQELDEARFDFEAAQGRSGQLEATVAGLILALEQTTVRAPFAGVVSARHTHMGQWLDVGAPVATLVSLAVLDVHLDVPATYVGRLNIGSEVEVRLVDTDRPAMTGTVRAMVPQADPQARTFPVYVSLPTGLEDVGVGMLAEVSLPVGQRQMMVVVPKDALIADGAAIHLFALDAEDRASRVAVETGEGTGAWIAVRGNVAAGDRVVVRGNERLTEGLSVQASVLEVPLP